jgi:hypothetical protein
MTFMLPYIAMPHGVGILTFGEYHPLGSHRGS